MYKLRQIEDGILYEDLRKGKEEPGVVVLDTEDSEEEAEVDPYDFMK